MCLCVLGPRGQRQPLLWGQALRSFWGACGAGAALVPGMPRSWEHGEGLAGPTWPRHSLEQGWYSCHLPQEPGCPQESCQAPSPPLPPLSQPLGHGEGGDTHGAVLGAGGRAVGTRGCHLPSEPCQGAVPISIGHHPARPEQGMSRLRAAGDGAPRGAAVPQHAGMSSRSSSCRPGLPYPAQMGSMGPILSGYPHVQC